MFWKKKKRDNTNDSKIILGMILLQDEISFNLDNFLSDFHKNSSYKIEELSGDSSSTAFQINGEMILIAHMPVPIPTGDIEGTAQYAYNWRTVLDDTKDHKSHLIVSVVQGGQGQIKRFKIFTQVISSLLRVTKPLVFIRELNLCWFQGKIIYPRPN